MTSFMGPMAPPPAAPPQPQAMDFQTDPTNRQRFRQFLNNRMQPPMMQQPSMMQAPMMQPPAHMPPILPEVDIFNPQGYADGGLVGGLSALGTMSKKMIDHLNNAVYGGASGTSINYSDSGMSSAPQNRLGGGLFQFDQAPQQLNIRKEMSPDSPYFNVPDTSQMQPLGGSNANNQNLMLSQGILGIPDATPLGQGTNMRSIFGFEDGGSVPPRRTDIRGQDHMLSYITPDEADILKALGGSGEAGPMGIPAYIGDNEGGQSSSGASEGDVGAGSNDSDEEGGGFSEADADQGYGGANGSGDNDNSSDTGEEAGGYEEIGAPAGYSDPPDQGTDGFDIDVDSVEVAQDQQDMGFDIFDTVEDFNQQQDKQAKDKAIKAAFVTDTSGKPIGTPDSPSGKFGGNLGKTGVDQDTIDKALGILAGVPEETTGISAVSGVNQDPISSSKAALLGLPPQDLLAIQNFEYAPPAQTNVSLSKNSPVSELLGIFSQGVPSVSNPIGLQDIQEIDELSFGPPAQSVSFNDPQYGNISQTTDFDLMGSPTNKTTTSDLADFSKTETFSSPMSSVSATSSNVANPNAPGQLSSEQISALDALADKGFEDETAAMGLRADDLTSSQIADNVAANIGYDPNTDMPYGLETVTDPQTGAQITTNLGGLTEQQIADQSFAMDIANLMGSKPYGYEIDPDGKVVGQVGTPGLGYLGNAISFVQDMFTGPPEDLDDLLARGAYTGTSGIDPVTGGGGDGPVNKKSVLDPCPPGFSLVNGVCTPVSDAGSSGPVADPAANPAAASIAPLPVIVPSSRQAMPFTGTMPSGYGTAVTGGVNPLVMSEMQKYAKLLSRPQPQYPVGLANGGPVSSNLDMAADNFLKALMPAA